VATYSLERGGSIEDRRASASDESVEVVHQTAQVEEGGCGAVARVRQAGAGGVRGGELAADVDQHAGPEILVDRGLGELTDLGGELPGDAFGSVDAVAGLVGFSGGALLGLFVGFPLGQPLGVDEVAGTDENEKDEELAHAQRLSRMGGDGCEGPMVVQAARGVVLERREALRNTPARACRRGGWGGEEIGGHHFAAGDGFSAFVFLLRCSRFSATPRWCPPISSIRGSGGRGISVAMELHLHEERLCAGPTRPLSLLFYSRSRS